MGQDPFLIAGTVFDNVPLGSADADRDRVACVLELVGAVDLIPRIDETIGERGTGLSNGQRRMVTLVRADAPASKDASVVGGLVYEPI